MCVCVCVCVIGCGPREWLFWLSVISRMDKSGCFSDVAAGRASRLRDNSGLSYLRDFLTLLVETDFVHSTAGFSRSSSRVGLEGHSIAWRFLVRCRGGW